MARRLAVLVAAAAIASPLVGAAVGTAPAGTYDENTMTVTARDYAYVVNGTLRPGQARIVFRNKGREPHFMGLLRIKPAATVKQITKALQSQSDAAFKKIVAGDPNAAYGTPDLLTPGGEAASITELVPRGTYAMICFIADAKGKPHFARGMVHRFSVSGKPSPAHPVDSDGTVVITDTSIQVPPGNAPSTATIEIDNQGTTPHSFAMVKLNGTATIPDVNDFFNKQYQGGPLPADAPGEILSSIGDIPPGGHVYMQWKKLPPGRYGYTSHSGDSQSPEGDDIAKGLYGEVTVG